MMCDASLQLVHRTDNVRLMGIGMTLGDIILNALNREYSLDLAASDLGQLMMERDLIRRKYGTDNPRLSEWEAASCATQLSRRGR